MLIWCLRFFSLLQPSSSSFGVFFAILGFSRLLFSLRNHPDGLALILAEKYITPWLASRQLGWVCVRSGAAILNNGVFDGRQFERPWTDPFSRTPAIAWRWVLNGPRAARMGFPSRTIELKWSVKSLDRFRCGDAGFRLAWTTDDRSKSSRSEMGGCSFGESRH